MLLLAYLEGEKARPRVMELLKDAELGECSVYLSLINLGEVLYITEREKGHILALQTLAAIDQLPLAYFAGLARYRACGGPYQSALRDCLMPMPSQ